MKLVRRLVFLIGILVVGVWLWSELFPSPEKAIRRHLEKTARTASFKANEGAIERIGNIAELAGCFSPDAELKFETPSGGTQTITGRSDILRAAGLARGMSSALQVDLLDASLSVAADKQAATVDLTARAKVPGDRDFFVQEMKFYLKKTGRSWLIIRVEAVKTLSAVN